MSYKLFKQEALCKQCRNCINETYGVRLTGRDCQYLSYLAPCKCCGQMRNIVTDVTPLGRLKFLLGKRKKPAET